MHRTACLAALGIVLLATGRGDADILIWVPPPEVTALRFSPDGKTVYSASQSGQVRIWDAASGKQRGAALAHGHSLTDLALSPDGKVLASAGGTVRLWDLAKGKELRILPAEGTASRAVAFSPDGKTIATGSFDRCVRLWDAATGKLLYKLPGHQGEVVSVAFRPDGKVLASGAVVLDDGNFAGAACSDHVRLWDVATGRPLARLGLCAHRLAFAPDGASLVGGGWALDWARSPDGLLPVSKTRFQVWGLGRDRSLLSTEGRGIGFALSPDGKYAATSWGPGGEHRWPRPAKGEKIGIDLREMATGQVVARFPVPEGNASALAFSPDGTRFAAGLPNGEVRFHRSMPDAKSPAVAAEKHIEALGGEAVSGYAALGALIGAGDKAVPLLRKQVKPAAPAPGGAPRLIANLASDDYATRERASDELAKFVPLLEADLTAALKSARDLEVRRRLQRLLDDDARRALRPEELRGLRAVTILERIGTRPAREALAELAKGAPAAPLTRDARFALERLTRKRP